jgi:hypothetical protein
MLKLYCESTFPFICKVWLEVYQKYNYVLKLWYPDIKIYLRFMSLLSLLDTFIIPYVDINFFENLNCQLLDIFVSVLL